MDCWRPPALHAGAGSAIWDEAGWDMSTHPKRFVPYPEAVALHKTLGGFKPGRDGLQEAGASKAAFPSWSFTAIKLSRHSGRDRRNPCAREGAQSVR